MSTGGRADVYIRFTFPWRLQCGVEWEDRFLWLRTSIQLRYEGLNASILPGVQYNIYISKGKHVEWAILSIMEFITHGELHWMKICSREMPRASRGRSNHHGGGLLYMRPSLLSSIAAVFNSGCLPLPCDYGSPSSNESLAYHQL